MDEVVAHEAQAGSTAPVVEPGDSASCEGQDRRAGRTGRAGRAGRAASVEALLTQLDRRGELTRQQLRDATGLSRSTVALLVSRLLAEGVVCEAQGATNGRGRPAQVVRRADPDGMLLGLDFGHNHLGVALASPAGEIVAERTVQASVDDSPWPTLHLAHEMALELLAERGLDLAGVTHAAAGMPGPMSTAGVLQIPSLLGNGEITEPGRALTELFGLPVDTVNDTVAGPIGEMHRGAGVGVRDWIYVKASHGIGAAVVIDGRLHRGGDGLAGEIGHTQIAGTTGRCRCGNVGCLEALAGLDGLAAELPAPYDLSSLHEESGGDPVLDRVVTDSGRAVGTTLAPIRNALNPSLIVIGGLLGSVHATALTKGVREALDRSAQPAIARALDVAPAQLGLRAELVGAIVLARRSALA